MGGKRFPIGDVITLVAAAIVAGGVSLTWFTLQITASQGTASFSLWGWQFALGWVACIAAVLGGLVGLAGLVAGGKLGRVGGFVILACGLVALAAVGIQLATAPDVQAMNEQIGSAFGAADLAAYNQKMSGWTVTGSTVETGIGLWVALAGGVLVLIGGGLSAALGGKKAPVVAGAWQPAAYAPAQQPAPYAQQPAPFAQQPYQPPVPGDPATGQQLPPPPGAGAATPPAPPIAAPVAVPLLVQPASTPAPQPTGAAPAKFCAKCGSVFDDDVSRFCVKCGASRPGTG